MTLRKCARVFGPTAAFTIALTMFGPACNGGPGGPSPTAVALSSITLASSSTVGGSPIQGTVTLSAPATTAAVVNLSSANAAVAAVPASVTVPAGNSTATFTVTTTIVLASTPVVITGSFNGTQTTTLTVAAPANPVLASVTMAAPTVIGGGSIQGTVTLNRAATAPSVVTLTSANPTVVVVPASVTVATGNTGATFTVTTGTVSASAPVVITGSFGGAQTTTLTVISGLTASFTVISSTEGNNGCRLASNGTLDCVFNGTGSTGPITSFTWTTTIGPNVFNQPVTTNTVNAPSTNGCGLFDGQKGGGATTALNMIVRLRVRDAAGNVAETTNNNVRVVPLAGTCGF